MTNTVLFEWPSQARESDERWTPRWVFEALAVRFDLDVAAPLGGVPWLPAERWYTAADDGLTQPWDGLVWMNPPYSDYGPWARRFVEHGNGVALFPFSVNASWMHDLVRAVPVVVLLEHVIFHHPTHTGRHVPVAIAATALGDGLAGLDSLAGHPRATRLVVSQK